MLFLLCWWVWYLLSIGMKVWLKVFLVNRWCRKLGMWNVMKKVLVFVEVFSSCVSIMLCISFSIRDSSVMLFIIRVEVSKLFFLFVVFCLFILVFLKNWLRVIKVCCYCYRFVSGIDNLDLDWYSCVFLGLVNGSICLVLIDYYYWIIDLYIGVGFWLIYCKYVSVCVRWNSVVSIM